MGTQQFTRRRLWAGGGTLSIIRRHVIGHFTRHKSDKLLKKNNNFKKYSDCSDVSTVPQATPPVSSSLCGNVGRHGVPDGRVDTIVDNTSYGWRLGICEFTSGRESNRADRAKTACDRH